MCRDIFVISLLISAFWSCSTLAAQIGDKKAEVDRGVRGVLRSSDAYITRAGNTWTMGSGKVERNVGLVDGKFVLQGFRSKATGLEMVPNGAVGEEFSFALKRGGERISGATGGWKLVQAKQTELNQGELQLDIVLQRGPLQVTKSYVVYPQSSIIREWMSFRNVGGVALMVVDPSFLSMTARLGDLESCDLNWMTGAENRPGSWQLKTEKLEPGKARVFDSYHPFFGAENEGYGPRAGSSIYSPWVSLYGKDSKSGLFVGWDYIGHWASSYTPSADGTVSISYKVAGHRQTLKPGQSLTTPMAFVGLYADDLDNAGNELLDWQYRYLWDYTREPWFPAIRMLGYWWNGTSILQPGNPWTGGKNRQDQDSAFRKVFRVADLMRYCGADVYHRDWGWWDVAGDWNGPDFRTTGDYLRKSDMGQLIYAFLYTVDKESRVAQEHPEWVTNDTLDMGRPEVVEFIKGQLDRFYEQWGPFEWRNDSLPSIYLRDDDTHMLAQDQGLRKIIKDFLGKYPDCAFQAVNGGGNEAGYDYVRYASALSFSDGAAGLVQNYYGSLLFPPDKMSDIPDKWDPNKYDKSFWRGLLCFNFDMTGDTWDRAKLEGVRELIDIYHYLHKHGVVGRWVKVYRPEIAGDDPTAYFQRMSADRKRGVIITKHPVPGPVTIKPRGLIPEETYFVSYQESEATAEVSGRELMEYGLSFGQVPQGELIYLNLPLHPGSKRDTQPPTAPSKITKNVAENMGHPGIELTWQPGTDDNWVSYYEILRNGVAIDKVSKGTYYFDHSAGADLAATYEVRTVDGAGNVSYKPAAQGEIARPSVIYDDIDPALTYTGNWNHQKDLMLAYSDTISWTAEKGASVELSFEGRKLLLFSKFGPNCGKAAVSIDGAPAETIDTFSADDIWGVCVYRKEFTSAGKHTVGIEVLGEHGELAKGTVVHVDGIRVEQ